MVPKPNNKWIKTCVVIERRKSCNCWYGEAGKYRYFFDIYQRSLQGHGVVKFSAMGKSSE